MLYIHKNNWINDVAVLKNSNYAKYITILPKNETHQVLIRFRFGCVYVYHYFL